MTDLDRFLQGQRAEGGLDSVGEFTIALEKARKKLEKYQLADPSFYLLKIFQAAVRAKAKEVHIKLTRREVYLWFETPERTFPLEDTLTGLDNALQVPDSGLRHLVLGVNASLVLEPEKVSWSEWSPEQNSGFQIENGNLQVGPSPKAPNKKFPSNGNSGYLFYVLKKPPGSIFRSASAEEHIAVSQRCGFAPAKVILDGRELSARWKTLEIAPWHAHVSKPFYLGERTVLDDRGRVEMPPVAHRKYKLKPGLWIRKDNSQDTFCHQFVDSNNRPQEVQPGQKLTCLGAYAIPLALNGPNTVTFVKDGVLLESVEVKAPTARLRPLGAVAIVDGKNLAVDMSEFKVLENEAFNETLEQCRKNWVILRELCREEMDQIKRATTDGEKKEILERTKGESLVCGGVGCFATPIFVGFVAQFLSVSLPGPFLTLSGLAGAILGYVIPRYRVEISRRPDSYLVSEARHRLGDRPHA